MRRLILKYATALLILLSILKAVEYHFFRYQEALSLYAGLIALVFLSLGAYVVWRWQRAKAHVPVQAERLNQSLRAEYSERELEVLELLSHGYSNKEIARLLSLSTNTIKTHLNNLYTKLEVSNRTQAVSEAKLLKIIN
ncbi:LuxR C-terminal-related transcriptional regulator [Pleionea litopenaei]|uniref:LuxR C-terminal-related transcriptional regulator n=1 Tax=Pleionea litopenaei TaxID=3070815 RepID=A0AA51RSG8_9GAMM|nr:LuxR C-terminal-related transcriptional regulator [Pleionea sp. HL-JVS1]WMS86776.1 LuxR C-terminal-related transcriptional regulator [Pleionea sp. HL-JVS1]